MIHLTKISKARPAKRFKVHHTRGGLPACGAGLRRGVYGDAFSYTFQETIENVDCLHCLELLKKDAPTLP